MFDRCIGCDRLGKDCVPNLMALPFPDMMNWWKKRQALLDWTNQELADRSGIPVGTINRIRKGEDDPRYSTMRSIIHALMGGHAAEFPCQKKLDAEFAHIEELEKQRQELIEERDAMLTKLQTLAELHRNDMLAIRDEYKAKVELLCENNMFMREQLKLMKEQLKKE